jgi:CHAT domain-containing protein/Tfp pilus assembly protein PilF
MKRGSLATCVGLALFVASSRSSALQAEPLGSYLQALAQIKTGELEGAIQTLERILERFPDFERAYGRLIEVHHRRNRDEDARSYFEGRLSRNPDDPYALYGLGLFLRQRGEPEDAARRFEECALRAPAFAPVYPELFQQLEPDDESVERIARQLGETLRRDPSNAAALLGMSLVHWRRDDEIRRGELLQNAVAAAPDLWDAQMELASYRASQGAIEEELEGLGELLQALETEGDGERAARVLTRIGDVYLETQEYERALDYFRRSRLLASEIGDSRTVLLAAARVGIVDKQQGRYREGLRAYEEALAVSREIGDRQSEGRMLGLIADVQAELADYREAIASFSESIAIAREAGDRGSEAQQLASLGAVQAALGDYDKALDHMGTALQLAKEENDRGLEQEFLTNQGVVYEKKGELLEALEAYAESARVARGQGDREAEATRLGYAGNVHARLGDFDEALRQYERGLAIAIEIGTVPVEAEISNDLGELLLNRGDVGRSVALHERALSIGEATRSLPVIWRAEAGLGAAFERRGETANALDHYRRAIEGIEAVRGTIDIAEEKASFFQDKVDVYRKVVNLLVRLEEAEPARGHGAEAFQYSERARARAFLDLMTEGRMSVETGIEPELLARQRELAQRMSDVQSQLIGAHSEKASAATLAELERELERADDDYLNLSREFRRRYPRYAEIQYPEPPRLSQIQEMLGDTSLLLEYLVGEGDSFLFAVRKKDYKVARLPGASQLREDVARLREAVSRPERASLATYVSVAKRLYDDLVLPAKELAEDAGEILVVPDDILHYLPFELLLKTTSGAALRPVPGQLPYLVRDHQVSYLPAAGLLPAVESAEAGVGREMDLLALGDPSYERDAAPSEISAGPATRGAFDGNEPWKLRRLTHSRDEVTRIAALYPEGRSDILLGEQATEQNLKSEERLSKFRIVHLAAHGLLNESRPQFSGLVVSLPRGPSSEDGLLQAYEIFNLELNAELVVLSACETGLGKEIHGEGIVGLTRAFLYAGAAAVVVSLWKVADASTAELMVRFHQHLRDPLRSRSGALRRAQLDLIESGAFAHPYYWAPFVLVGKP